jgi:hypothetical protein
MTMDMHFGLLLAVAIATLVACGPTKPVAGRNSAESSTTSSKGAANAEAVSNSAVSKGSTTPTTSTPTDVAAAPAPADGAKSGGSLPISDSALQSAATGIASQLAALVSTPQGMQIVKEILAVPQVKTAIQSAGLGAMVSAPESLAQLLKNPLVITAITGLVTQAVSGKLGDVLSPSSLVVLLAGGTNGMAVPTQQHVPAAATPSAPAP